jgi:hypothetical protein
MSPARPELAEINASINRGEWWLRLFDELSRRGARHLDGLSAPRGGLVRGMGRAADRAGRGLRLALIAILRLEQILASLAALRLRSAADIAAARARALDRAKARGQTEVRRTTFGDEEEEDEDEDEDWPERDTSDRETQDRDPRDRLVDALDRRLAAVDPAFVDFDELGLRETVLSICADLGITPDWVRWEAGDWEAEDTPVQARPVAPALREGPQPADTTPIGLFLIEREAERWRPRLE